MPRHGHISPPGSYARSDGPTSTTFCRHQAAEVCCGAVAARNRDAPCSRPLSAPRAFEDSEHGDGTSSSWSWQDDGTSTDLCSEPEACQDPTGPDDAILLGSDGADSAGARGAEHDIADERAATCSRPGEREYQERFGKEIEAWLSDLERRAAQNTNVYLRDGVTPNPARAPYVSLQVDPAVASEKASSDTGGEPGPFWKWSVLLQRWIHEDNAAGILLIYPKELIH